MKILLLGADGYLGRSLTQHLSHHELTLVDNYSRRELAKSLTPLPSKGSPVVDMDVGQINLKYFGEFDAIVHLAEMPSAPWSMKSRNHAYKTQQANTLETLSLLWTIKEYSPDAHLVKLGSMGEYGTPDCDIPEGFIPAECPTDLIDEELLKCGSKCPYAGMQFPKQPGSFYHLSKVFDSMNIDFACRMWGLRSTDINQGVVFGLNYWDRDLTRFDYDQYFGTVINRFCAQAVAGIPLTVYGKGGQTRGFLPLEDSIKCLTLAIENPPEPGEYRVFNQYAEIKSVNELAHIVRSAAKKAGIHPSIQNIENPRIESENHTYETTNENLRKLGYEPNFDFQDEVEKLINTLLPYKDQINESIIMPTTSWK